MLSEKVPPCIVGLILQKDQLQKITQYVSEKCECDVRFLIIGHCDNQIDLKLENMLSKCDLIAEPVKNVTKNPKLLEVLITQKI